MTTWQRRMRLGLGVFVVAFAVVVFLSIGRRSGPSLEVPAPREDPNATSEVRGGHLIQARGAQTDFRIFHEKVFTYPDGRNRIVGLRAELHRVKEGNLTITAEEGEVAPGRTDVSLRGNVRCVSEDGLELTTNEGSYSESEGIFRAPGRVRFAKGRASGTGVGMTYDDRRDVVWLLDQAVVEFAGEGEEAPATISAGAAGWARSDGYMRFERSVQASRGGRTLASETAVVYLNEDQETIDTIELRDNASITWAPEEPSAGALEEMRADILSLVYAGDGERLAQATLAGNASIRLTASAPGLPGRRLAADWIDVVFAEDGTTVDTLNAHNGVELTLPGGEDEPSRIVRGRSLSGSGRPGRGLSDVRFDGGDGRVEYVESTAGSGSRVASAERLELRMEPGLGAVNEASFRGRTHFREGGLEAWARDGRYSISAGTIVLDGEVDGALPRVRDERASIEAELIKVALGSQGIEASGRVQSVLLPSPEAGEKDTGRKRPGILAAERPANATSDSVTYDSEAGLAVYRGNARLWQDETAIIADRIQIDDRSGNLEATGGVRATMRDGAAGGKASDAGPAASGGAAAGKVTTATAGSLVYEDAARRVTYMENAHVIGPQGDLTADKVEMYLSDEAGALERAEAYGKVTVRLSGRSATGDRLSYLVSKESYVMVGSPVRIIEECRETQGKTLTFFKSADTIIVDGNGESRTQTKGGAKCGEPRFD